jgi:catechol 1,2-dioxygenase
MDEDSERLRQIWEKTVEKLKEVVHEFAITQDELHVAGDYLNRAGKANVCRSLIDVSLAMTSIDATVRVRNGTRPNLEGPYHAAHPMRPSGKLFNEDLPPDAPRLILFGRVTDAATGKPIHGAKVDLWQADHVGGYDLGGTNFRGIVVADDEGRYEVQTVVPGDYSDHDDDPIGELFQAMGRHNRRAAHIHVKIWVDGAVVLTTQIFVPGSTYLDSDYVEGAVSDDLIMNLIPDQEADGAKAIRVRFDFAVPVAAAISRAS